MEAGRGLYICVGILEMEKSGVESMKRSVMAVPSTHLPLPWVDDHRGSTSQRGTHSALPHNSLLHRGVLTHLPNHLTELSSGAVGAGLAASQGNTRVQNVFLKGDRMNTKTESLEVAKMLLEFTCTLVF